MALSCQHSTLIVTLKSSHFSFLSASDARFTYRKKYTSKRAFYHSKIAVSLGSISTLTDKTVKFHIVFLVNKSKELVRNTPKNQKVHKKH